MDEKENPQDEMLIPDYAFKSMAACLLPIIQKYYETDEGKRMFEEWKAQQNNEKKLSEE